jgi:hypothetical protein
MKSLMLSVISTVMLITSGFANAGLIDLDFDSVDEGQIEFSSAATALDLFGDFDFKIPVFMRNGTEDLDSWIDVIGYSTNTSGNNQNISTLYDFSTGVQELIGWELSLSAITGNTNGNITDITGSAVLSNQIGSINFDISGIHTAFYDTQRFTYASFVGMLTVADSGINNPGNGSVDVPEPSTIVLFGLAMIGLLNRKKLV